MEHNQELMDVSTKGYPIKRVGSQEYKLNENTFDPHFGSSPPINDFLDKLKQRNKNLFNKFKNDKTISLKILTSVK